MVGSIPKLNPRLQDPHHDDQAIEDAGGTSQEILLDGHAPAAVPDSGQSIVAEDKTYVSEDEWPATVEASVPATAVARVLNSTSDSSVSGQQRI